jgi:hypothetical protein
VPISVLTALAAIVAVATIIGYAVGLLLIEGWRPRKRPKRRLHGAERR